MTPSGQGGTIQLGTSGTLCANQPATLQPDQGGTLDPERPAPSKPSLSAGGTNSTPNAQVAGNLREALEHMKTAHELLARGDGPGARAELTAAAQALGRAADFAAGQWDVSLKQRLMEGMRMPELEHTQPEYERLIKEYFNRLSEIATLRATGRP